MNAGAATSSGDVLLFLHADTPASGPLEGARGRIDLRSGQSRGTVPIRHRPWEADNTGGSRGVPIFRSRILGITYGDQAIYTTRAAFESVGGFPGIPVFEDARFADRLKKAGGLDWIDEAVLTSARRWERRGPVRTLLLTWLLRMLYTLFVPPRFLARFYGVVR